VLGKKAWYLQVRRKAKEKSKKMKTIKGGEKKDEKKRGWY